MSTTRERTLIASVHRWAMALDAHRACRPPRRRALLAAYQQRQREQREALAIEAATLMQAFDALYVGERSRLADAAGYGLWLALQFSGEQEVAR